MNERKKWIRSLDKLWMKNLRVSQFYRRATAVATDRALKAALIRFSSKRAQFAFEIGSQVQNLGGKILQQEWTVDFKTNIILLNLTEENTGRIFGKSITTEKESLKDYTSALAVVNHGPTREILIRHKAGITQIIKELQILQSLHLSPGSNENLKTN